MAFNFTIEKTVATINETESTKKLLTVTAWKELPGKLDLRTWRKVDGELQPGRGVTLTREEAETLANALADYLKL